MSAEMKVSFAEKQNGVNKGSLVNHSTGRYIEIHPESMTFNIMSPENGFDKCILTIFNGGKNETKENYPIIPRQVLDIDDSHLDIFVRLEDLKPRRNSKVNFTKPCKITVEVEFDNSTTFSEQFDLNEEEAEKCIEIVKSSRNSMIKDTRRMIQNFETTQVEKSKNITVLPAFQVKSPEIKKKMDKPVVSKKPQEPKKPPRRLFYRFVRFIVNSIADL